MQYNLKEYIEYIEYIIIENLRIIWFGTSISVHLISTTTPMST